jgi:hypothetical protein
MVKYDHDPAYYRQRSSGNEMVSAKPRNERVFSHRNTLKYFED